MRSGALRGAPSGCGMRYALRSGRRDKLRALRGGRRGEVHARRGGQFDEVRARSALSSDNLRGGLLGGQGG